MADLWLIYGWFVIVNGKNYGKSGDFAKNNGEITMGDNYGIHDENGQNREVAYEKWLNELWFIVDITT